LRCSHGLDCPDRSQLLNGTWHDCGLDPALSFTFTGTLSSFTLLSRHPTCSCPCNHFDSFTNPITHNLGVGFWIMGVTPDPSVLHYTAPAPIVIRTDGQSSNGTDISALPAHTYNVSLGSVTGLKYGQHTVSVAPQLHTANDTVVSWVLVSGFDSILLLFSSSFNPRP
jgi:hypothetical protein